MVAIVGVHKRLFYSIYFGHPKLKITLNVCMKFIFLYPVIFEFNPKVLSDDSKRKQYDTFGAAGANMGQGAGGFGQGFGIPVFST